MEHNVRIGQRVQIENPLTMDGLRRAVTLWDFMGGDVPVIIKDADGNTLRLTQMIFDEGSGNLLITAQEARL